ncbi:hypothetical protein A3718_06690 [Erythrobacter sp. HI0019]|uniref:hypothetical protein n=1 Tax=unclassified Erythrobacter TaxID=2633097 RepID=UPI0007B92F5C|nr:MULTISPECIES: hypothetical protein [unclassified Erythrobacter]KZX94827.1 hypothetical protein A3718_06690 [Erythrobacter sp. HI0019]KZY09070.1 hypothetical protein A3723_11080 [Erythrobacter sp. HI0028]
MTISIGEVFDLVFNFTASDRVRYEGRRWFRRPQPSQVEVPVGGPTRSQIGGEDEVSVAEGLLAERIATLIPKWALEAGCIEPPSFDAKRHLPPRLPYDVFAIAAHLVEQSGIYHHLQPAKVAAVGGELVAPQSARLLEIDEDDRTLVSRAAKIWADLPRVDVGMHEYAERLLASREWDDLLPLFESWWVVFAAYSECEVRDRPRGEDGPERPDWWKHAWRLLAIADEAAAGTGFVFDVDEVRNYLEGKKTEIKWFEADVIFEHMIAASEASEEEGVEKAEFADINSLSVARNSMLNVLPKVRTPSVGCTLRSISHHLALLPPVGVVKGQWTPNYRRRPSVEGKGPDHRMNLLLVPLPFSLGARCFKPAFVECVDTPLDGAEAKGPKIGYFDVEQEWLSAGDRDGLEIFVEELVREAKCHATEIHGLVFPELALDYPHFTRIKDMLREKCEGIELIVAGTKTNRLDEIGNFVAASTFKDTSKGLEGGRETVREKHHRWKLDAGQLRDYGLQGTLSPELGWWENISLQSRQVDFTVMRKDSVFAAMICEDLARVDPCQQIIRAVGPNLVIALLMDAPQIEARWPARYATVLAEDPGCAVLTLTSRGLMTLQDRLGTFRSKGDDRIIALWRDDGSARPTTINCPYDAQGVVLTIVEGPSSDISLDGRVDKHAKAWRYAGHVPVRLEKAQELHGHILGPENLASF